MKTRQIVPNLVTGLVAWAVSLTTGVSGGSELVVLVLPFENLSRAKSMTTYEVMTSPDPDKPKRSFSIDRYSEAPRGILEDIFVNWGVKVVERQRVDALLLESEFGRLSGLVDTAKAVQLGKMLGATTIVMGTVADVNTHKSTFSGYGIRTEQTKVTALLRVRVIEIETGLVKYSTSVEGTASYSSSAFGGTSDSDVAFQVIRNALEKLRDDVNFKQSLLGKTTEGKVQEVAIRFAPVPENCDIEIDGFYVGSSPVTINLPTNKPVKVRITKPGYQPWEVSMVPKEGLVVKPELAREQDQKK